MGALPHPLSLIRSKRSAACSPQSRRFAAHQWRTAYGSSGAIRVIQQLVLRHRLAAGLQRGDLPRLGWLDTWIGK